MLQSFLQKDHLLLICPTQFKVGILEELNQEKKILDISFLTIEQYKKNYFFDYDVEAISYLVKNENLSPNNAKEIIENLIYIDDTQDYENQKLKDLVEYKKKLDENQLLFYNPLFLNYLNQKNVVVYGYGNLDAFTSSLIKGKTVEVIPFEKKEKTYKINQFKTMEEEVEHLYNEVLHSLSLGDDINHIFVIPSSADYYSYFKRFNNYYPFTIDPSEENNLYGTALVNDFLLDLETKTKEEIYQNLLDANNEQANSLINILNKYASLDLEDAKSLIKEDIKKLKNRKEYKNVVKTVGLFSNFDKNDQVFLIGFNDSVPATKSDTSYITDNMKKDLGLPLVEEENKLIKENTKDYLSTISHLYLSFSEKSVFSTYNKQTLFSNSEVIYEEIEEKTYKNSELLNLTKYKIMLDNYVKFHHYEKEFLPLILRYANYHNELNFDNKFTGLSEEQIPTLSKQINQKEEENHICLSYSNMDNFYKCKFMYYLSNVLKLNEFNDTYFTLLGTICHNVLKDLFIDPNFDFEISWNKSIELKEKQNQEKIFTSEKEQYFANQIKEELLEDIQILKEQESFSSLKEKICERNFETVVSDNISFKGYIDKLMYEQKDDDTFVSIVDYKTGSTAKIREKLMDYGLSLQLPSYLYLLSKDPDFKDSKVVGLYLQYLVNTDRKYEEGMSLLDKKKKSMLLKGMSSSDLARVQHLDHSLNEEGVSSSVISSIKLKKGLEFYDYSPVYMDERFIELSSLVEDKIKEAGNEILNGDFSINPKMIDGNNESCKYCKFSDICYRYLNDFVYIQTGEEEDA